MSNNMKRRILILISTLLLLVSYSTLSFAASEETTASDTGEAVTIDATAYYYDKFDNDAYRNVYDQINQAANNFHNSTTNGEYQDEGYYAAFSLSVSKKDWEVIGADGLDKAVKAVMADHPEYFWMSADYIYETRTSEAGLTYYLVTIKCYDIYANGTSRQVVKNNMDITIGNYGTSIDASLPDYIKVYLVHNAIIEDVYYKTDAAEMNSENVWAYTADGIFNSKYKSAVSFGYAKAFKAVMDYLNIPCIYVEGNDVENKDEDIKTTEAWNQVYIAGEWYLIDLAFDDPETTTGKDVLTYDYFNITTEKASGMAKPLTVSDSWLSGVPECKGTEFSLAKIQQELEKSNVWQESNYNFIDKIFDKYGISVVLISIGAILILIVLLIKEIHKKNKKKRKEKIKNTKTKVVDHSELDEHLKRPPLS